MNRESGEQIDISGTNTTRGIYYHGKKSDGRVVVAQAGLGATIELSGFIGDIRNEVKNVGNFSLLAIDHPGHGISKDDENTPYTLRDCESSTMAAISHILSNPNTTQVICAGNSLGFWALFQTIAQLPEYQRILGLLGKSGIVSYRSILRKFLQPFGGETDAVSALEKLKERMGTRPDGWGALQINPGDEPVRIHSSFLDQIEKLDEKKSIPIPLEVWHGEKDGFSSLSEMQGHNGGDILLHTQHGMDHGLTAAGDDSVSRRVNQEMITRIREIFEARN